MYNVITLLMEQMLLDYLPYNKMFEQLFPVGGLVSMNIPETSTANSVFL